MLAEEQPDRLLPILQDVLVRGAALARRSSPPSAWLVVAPDRRSLRLFLAGHPAPLLLLDDVPAASCPTTSSARRSVSCPGSCGAAGRSSCPPDWRLLLFTDGLVEGYDEPGRPARRRAALASRAGPRCERALYDDSVELVEDLFDGAPRLHGGDLPDDVAVLVVERAPAAASA